MWPQLSSLNATKAFEAAARQESLIKAAEEHYAASYGKESKRLSAKGKIHIERGSGNVFAALGRPDAEAHRLKAELVARIDAIVRERGLTQAQAAKRLGLSQPDVSRLLRGSFCDYSVERLLQLLMILGRVVAIVIRKSRARRPGRLRVEAA